MEGTERESNAHTFRVLMFPWLAHGHISPFIELSKRLSKSNFQVYLCSTEINLNFIKQSRKFDENSSHHSIELVQLDLPDLPELPPHYHTTKNLPPHLQSTLRRALYMAKTNFQNILNTLKPDLLVYDGFQPWASELAALNHIPSVLFLVVGAVNLSSVYHSLRCRVSGANETYPFPAIFYRDYEIKKILAKLQESKAKEGDEFDVFKSIELSSDIVLVKSWREIEGKYIDHLSSSCGKKLIAVGPLSNPEGDSKEADSYSHIIEFLNSKDEASLVYVSFGSEYFLSKEEREEIAIGLELSNANFIWVVRFPVGHAIGLEEALPEGFLERVKGRGTVVNGWAPQAKILGHRSTGGFVSHCGWGSVIESIYYGVPLLALPMHLDQPLHARLAVEIGVGIEILKDADGQIKREDFARVINEVVVKKKEGQLQRQKAMELSKKLREEGEEELHEAIEKLRSLCSKNK
ncbi:beta-D-glucosyl crocetin beta-1,6-glucosyltransferase-like [Coffea eugenioides]|uniref:Glycosyltransferase n=1 Tax=Coffea arabica TaxID=13443 RepID=A0A6P6V8S2_COFAR|nr:beta-D-glucosyl crocetin beta-1,6-glucosyltransferase-like [Coffea arabica]XP_027153067.1 beta-D-glucosyl crocetin beta-1,6-glucosyltransferase-like [Coffea eugenioides]XP_027156768.1 beta-D-glucosyl crocetin beta-1,6-glucosyltransferase-like [Coffea eugenioides]